MWESVIVIDQPFVLSAVIELGHVDHIGHIGHNRIFGWMVGR